MKLLRIRKNKKTKTKQEFIVKKKKEEARIGRIIRCRKTKSTRKKKKEKGSINLSGKHNHVYSAEERRN